MTPIDKRYPIGKFESKNSYTSEEVASFIKRIAEAPTKYELVINKLTDAQLDTPYREGGWTVRQVIHHVADSHTNAFIRIKWTLTEDKPMIKAYEEKLWAETPETKLPPSLSLNFLHALHAKWVELAKRLSAEDLTKKFIHPESKKEIRLDQLLGTYAWHGDHHLAHITELKRRMGW
ncbi:MAG: YfiT family bacillithiol transferase [Cyclobacteriaceae bacterium]